MPNINQELVKAFNISVCYNNIINTSLKVQNVRRGSLSEDHIVISFDKDMVAGQCMEYLNDMKRRIVETFCGNESAANVSFNTDFFPFKFNKGQLSKDKEGRYRFSVPMDKGVIFNLKCYLVHAFARDVIDDMQSNFGENFMEGRVYDVSFDKKLYLYCMQFNDKKLQEDFIELFSSKITGYENGPRKTNDFLKERNNRVYIKRGIFDKVKFIEDIGKDQACTIGRDLQTRSLDDPAVEKIKYVVADFIRRTCSPFYSLFHISYSGSNEDSILLPIAQDGEGYRFLTKKEVDNVNSAFGMAVLNNVEGYTSPKHLPVSGNRGVYGIDFSNSEISHCVINRIIENSVINKNHELSIDPELFARAVSRTPSLEELPPKTQLESPRRERVLSHAMYHTIDQPRSLSAAAVDVDESEQGACGGSFSPESRMQAYHGQGTPPPAPSASDEEGSKSGSESPKKRIWSWDTIKNFLQKPNTHDKNFERHGAGRDSKISIKSAPDTAMREKQRDPKQHNTFPTRLSNIVNRSITEVKEDDSLGFPHRKYKFSDGSTYVPDLTQKDIFEGKRKVLSEFLRCLPFKADKESEKKKMLMSLSSFSPKEVEDLYSSFSSACKREKLCSKLPFNLDDNKHQVEFLWEKVHQSYTEELFLSDTCAKLERSKQSNDLVRNEPGCRDSIVSTASKSSGYVSWPSQTSIVDCTAGPSDRGKFPRGGWPTASSSSSSSNLSSRTVVKGNIENKGASRENPPLSLMDIAQIVQSPPSQEHLNFLDKLKRQRAEEGRQIRDVRDQIEMGVIKTRSGSYSRYPS